MTKTLYINGHLYGRATDEPQAIVVQDGKIEAIGGQKELMLQLSGRHYEIVDWQGGYVLPGLVDSHMHLSMHGMKLSMLDFSAASSRREMLDMLRRKAETTSSGEWILGLNWNENAFPDRMAPHISELDEITSTHPVFLTRTCFHAFLANTEAFRRAGVHKDTPDPASGSFGRDEYGELNGWVYEEASFLFQKVQPQPDYATKKQMIRQSSLDALRLGLTGVHTEDLRLHGSVETMLGIHRELLEEGVALRTHHLLYHPFLEEAVGLGLHAGSGDEWLKMGSVKLFVDGAIGGRTALLREPYYDDDQTMGMAIHSLDGLEKLVAAARQAGFPIAAHAIGDGAADLLLTALEKHRLPATSMLPDRFIHAQVLDRGLVERMSQLHLIADIQPRFVVSDFPWVLERVGPHRTEFLYAWRKLMQAGIPCAGGSDAPIEPLDPLLGLHAAVTRRKPEESHEGYITEEKLSLSEALLLFSKGGAVAAGEVEERGIIQQGCRADFTVLDRELMQDDPDDVLKARVQMTIVNGVMAYQA
ncbi:amidohydrolase [Paenibacillus massiliensis]|uniref:amidohydrolase n=1 Tax=Paenibacillus massiliensis TaxID=225917 RepID=UPI000369CF80|nr:amidohydrolase [Paenibacillus massiliensis]